MKWSKLSNAAVVAVLMFAGAAWASEEAQTYQIKNRLRVEYDDNIYETQDNKTESWSIIEDIELLLNLNFEQTFLGLRYRPTFQWWDNRESDDTDIHHDFDLVFAHSFTPRLSLSLKDTLRIAQIPQELNQGTIVQQNEDFTYNVTDGALSYLLQPKTRLEVNGRYTILQYDESDVSDNEDYDIAAGGLTLRQQVRADTAVSGDLRYEEVNYDGPDRGSQSIYAGLGLEEIFSPNFLGNLRAGYQEKEFNEDGLDSESSPYADASVTYLPSPATRLTAGVGYSMFEANVFPYASQDRTVMYASLAYDITARIALYVAGSYQMSEYNADTSIDATTTEDGDEEYSQFSTRVSYKVNRSNWLEAGWQYLDLSSDLRNDFDRNRFDVGWRTQL